VRCVKGGISLDKVDLVYTNYIQGLPGNDEYIFSIQHLLDIINTALKASWAGNANPPFLFFNASTNKLQFYADDDSNNDYRFSKTLFRFLQTFPSNLIDVTETRDWFSLRPITGQASINVIANNVPAGYTVMNQEASMFASWNDIIAINVISPDILVGKEFSPSPLLLDNGQSNASTSATPVVTDFHIPLPEGLVAGIRGQHTYFADNLRFRNITPSDVSRLTMSYVLVFRDGSFLPLYLLPNDYVNVSFVLTPMSMSMS
jgi:hypothetical protein